MNSRLFLFILSLILLLFIVSTTAFSQYIKVTTTTNIIKDLAINIGGDKVVVQSLMGSGVDPHLYKAKFSDLKKIKEADIVLYNGLHLEGKMGNILQKLKKNKKAYAIADSIEESNLIKAEGFSGSYDPHIWFDITLWQKCAYGVTQILSQYYPAGREYFQSQYELYNEQLRQLKFYVIKNIETIPKQQRVLVTAHDAFNYFGRAYGIKVVGLQGISTASEYGLKDIKRVSDIIIKHKIKAIFVETSVPKRFIESLQQGLIAKGFYVKIGGELYSDSLGMEGTAEGTYIGMVKHNVRVIVSNLK